MRLSWADKSRVVVVSFVDPTASVAQLLRKGDVISEINGRRPKNGRLAALAIHDTDGLLELRVRTCGLLHPTSPGPMPSKVKPAPVVQ